MAKMVKRFGKAKRGNQTSAAFSFFTRLQVARTIAMLDMQPTPIPIPKPLTSILTPNMVLEIETRMVQETPIPIIIQVAFTNGCTIQNILFFMGSYTLSSPILLERKKSRFAVGTFSKQKIDVVGMKNLPVHPVSLYSEIPSNT